MDILRRNFRKTVFILTFLLQACGGGGSGGGLSEGDIDLLDTVGIKINIDIGEGGYLSSRFQQRRIITGTQIDFTIIPLNNYDVESVQGCRVKKASNSENGNSYNIRSTRFDSSDIQKGECTLKIGFEFKGYIVKTFVGTGGSIIPLTTADSLIRVAPGNSTNFTVIPDSGFEIASVKGCGGSLVGNLFTTAQLTNDCKINASFAENALPGNLVLNIDSPKVFRFSWIDVAGSTHYKLMEDPDGVSGYSQTGPDIPQGTQEIEIEVPLHLRINANYKLQACDAGGCVDSPVISVDSNIVPGVGYFKASNANFDDKFGSSVRLSGDGNTMVISAPYDDLSVTGINSDQYGVGLNDNGFLVDTNDTGSVYVFAKKDNIWEQQAFIKSSETKFIGPGEPGGGGMFGQTIAISDDGDTLVVGESAFLTLFNRTSEVWSEVAQIDNPGSEFCNSLSLSGDGKTLAFSDVCGTADNGIVYLYTNNGVDNIWTLEVTIVPDILDTDNFGFSIDLSDDGNTLAIGANNESSNSTDVNGNELDNSIEGAGAVYIYVRSMGSWNRQAYIKASNSGEFDRFGNALKLSGDGDTLAVGATGEDSDGSGVNGNEASNSASAAGAVYVYVRSGTTWAQQSYIKASNTDISDKFGSVVDLSDDGNILLVSAVGEEGQSTGFNGNDSINSAFDSGAAYLYLRSGIVWEHSLYIKSSRTKDDEKFGASASISDDGQIIAVGAPGESFLNTGINNDFSLVECPTCTSPGFASGAVYLY